MRRRWLLLIVVYAVLIGGGWFLGQWLSQYSVVQVRPINEPEVHSMVMAVSAIFIAASATPFVPGAEIGFGLIVVLGSRIVLLVYICMVLALAIAYFVGRFVPPRMTAALFGYLRLQRTRDLILRSSDLDSSERVPMLVANAPNRFVPFLLRHRYVALAVAFNLPGNSILGGGGGLSLAAGMSGLFGVVPFIVTAAIAVAPVPLFILLTGYQP